MCCWEIGKVMGHTYVVEFQNRGLPHAHILIILDKTCKLRTADDFDKVIFAEIPCKYKHQRLYRLVTQFMVHNPCGSGKSYQPCMKKNSCSKYFPKESIGYTLIVDDGYPAYRRRDRKRGGRYFIRKRKNGHEEEIDNKWIVAYNPYLLLKYECHINVEVCNSFSAVKYLYKYVN